MKHTAVTDHLDIAFYAPLKSPEDDVPSGDRQMARALMKAVTAAGHRVTLVSQLRSFHKAADPAALAACENAAALERQRISALWQDGAKPDLWLTYHPYYKAPDLLGPALATQFALPYVTAEASYAPRRDRDDWRDWQKPVGAALRQAALNLCYSRPDYLGLAQFLGSEQTLADFPPFLETDGYVGDDAPKQRGADAPVRLICVAMMRPGVKVQSYDFLARSLSLIDLVPWHLTIVGDGPARAQVEDTFRPLPREQYSFRGTLAGDAVRTALQEADLYLWPGFGEAYGIAYLEAQAAGLPIVALDEGGIASVLRPGETGALITEKTPAAYAQAAEALMRDHARRDAMGRAAAAFIHNERSLSRAAQRLHHLLHDVLKQQGTKANTHA